MLSWYYLFESVLKKVVDDIKTLLQQEVSRHPDYFADIAQGMSISEIFEHFPRESPKYCSIISTLSEIAGYSVTEILKYLTGICATVYSGKGCSVFRELHAIQFPNFVTSRSLASSVLKFLELIFITDLICTIVARYGVPDNVMFLINCGLYMCSSEPSIPAMTHLILEQWSVVFSFISMKQPSALFERSTQFIINKADLFFLIMKFVRLDAPGCPASDLIEIMTMHLHRARQRKRISNPMLTSMATFLMTYQGEDTSVLKPFFDIATGFCKSDPTAMPGAVDLVVNLMVKMKWTEEEQKKFYYETVFPMAKTQEGIITAVKALRKLMCGELLSVDWLYWVWGPEPRANEFDFLKWSGSDDYVGIFMDYFIDTKYYNVCPRLMKERIVHLAALDFQRFSEVMFPRFVTGIDKNPDRFMCFLSIVPMINDPYFLREAKSGGMPVTKDMIMEFNDRLGRIAAAQLSSELSSMKTFGLTQDQCAMYLQDISCATNEIGKTLDNWEIDPGLTVELGIAGVGRPVSSPSTRYLTLVKILPYILNSDLVKSSNGISDLVKLAASPDYSIAKQAYHLCQSLVKNPENQSSIIRELVKLVDISQKEAIVFVCIQLLVDAVNDMEPRKQDQEDELEYDIEFAGFLALASEQPVIRIVGFDLIQKINKLLKHGGFYSHLEDSIEAVESNVKHALVLQHFPKHPCHYKFPHDNIKLRSALCSSYHSTWLCFLAEFGRIILAANYRPMLKRISAIAKDFKWPKYVGHFLQGIFVVFLSTCCDEKYNDDTTDVYVSTNPFSQELMGSFSQTLTQIIDDCKQKDKTAFRPVLSTAIKYINYSLVPMVIDHYPFNFQGESIRLEEVLQVLFHMLKAIDGNKRIKREIYFPVITRIIMPLFKQFVDLGLTNPREVFWSQRDRARKPLEIANPELNDDKFKRCERLILWFLSSIIMLLDDEYKSEAQESQVFRYQLMLCVLTWASMQDKSTSKRCRRIKTYGAAALVPIFESGPCFVGDIVRGEKCSDILLACAKIELKGFPLMKPLLMNNRQLLQHFITMCFTKKSTLSDVFFEAVYESFSDVQHRFENDASRSDDGVFVTMAGDLFLLGLFRLKTGSLLAKPFLTQYSLYYSRHIQYKDEAQLLADLQNKDISEVPAKHFVRVREFVVAGALKRMLLPKFKGTVKVMSEIMMPWVKHFRMLPKQELCMPQVNITGMRLTTKAFLEQLMLVTAKKLNEHDFDKLVDVWSLLLEVEDQQDIVFGFITEGAIQGAKGTTDKEKSQVFSDIEYMNEVKKALFICLLEKKTALTIERIAQRCSFAFYAYVTYEMEGELEQELWMIPVLVRALKYHKDAVQSYLSLIIHFALLFHANQTQTLLKRVCKTLSVPYSRRTLSTGSIRRIVDHFQINIDTKSVNKQDFVNKWAKEAMRWAVGSRVLRISHMSLVILNKLNYQISDQDVSDLLRGICKSAGYFLKGAGSSYQITYDFINETFVLFHRHFQGHEQICLDYVNSFMDFVVSVDAYFSNMLPLYSLCLESDVTRDQASKVMLSALRPSFNELEGDSKARETFDNFVKRYPLPDLKFVNAVLSKSSESELMDEATVGMDCPLDVLNRVLNHYSLMIDTASTDLKKRIFTISTLIVNKFTEHQESKPRRSSHATEKGKESERSPTPQITKSGEDEPAAELQSQVQEEAPIDLDKQSLVIIFQAAIKLLPGTKQALDFIMAISHNDPLIPTIPVIADDETNKQEVFQRVVDSLTVLGRHEKEVVTLTDCMHVRTSSNLLDQTSKPQILPFTLQTKRKEQKPRSGLSVDQWMRTFSSLGMELHRKMAERIRPKTTSVVDGTYRQLSLPDKLVTDDKLKANNLNYEVQKTISNEEFLKLGE